MEVQHQLQVPEPQVLVQGRLVDVPGFPEKDNKINFREKNNYLYYLPVLVPPGRLIFLSVT